MNTQSITALVTEITAAKDAIKQLAVATRAAAPKGEKMAYGQHASAEQSAKVAASALAQMPGLGYTLAAVSTKTSKTGHTDVSFTYRVAQTLAQRVATVNNAAARRTAKRLADKAAKDAATAAKTTVMPKTEAKPDTTALLAQLTALMQKAA